MNLTEEEIAARLSEAQSTASTDGYAQSVTTPVRKCAAVLVPLLLQDGEWRLLYTRRTDLVESHKGQVSFPGGACDDGETTPEETALRKPRRRSASARVTCACSDGSTRWTPYRFIASRPSSA